MAPNAGTWPEQALVLVLGGTWPVRLEVAEAIAGRLHGTALALQKLMASASATCGAAGEEVATLMRERKLVPQALPLRLLL